MSRMCDCSVIKSAHSRSIADTAQFSVLIEMMAAMTAIKSRKHRVSRRKTIPDTLSVNRKCRTTNCFIQWRGNLEFHCRRGPSSQVHHSDRVSATNRRSLVRYRGAVPSRHRCINTVRRKAIRCGTCSQWRSQRSGITWSNFHAPWINLAAALTTDWSLSGYRRPTLCSPATHSQAVLMLVPRSRTEALAWRQITECSGSAAGMQSMPT